MLCSCVERQFGARACACESWRLSRQSEMVEYLAYDNAVGDQCDQLAPCAAVLAAQNVDGENALQAVSPCRSSRVGALRRVGAACGRAGVQRGGARRPDLSRSRHDQVATRHRWREHAVTGVLMGPGARNLRDDPFKEGQRVEGHGRGAIAPVSSQAIDDAPIGREREPLSGNGWSGYVTVQMPEALALSGRHDDLCMQQKAVVVAAQRSAHEQRTDLAASAEAQGGRVLIVCQRGAALDGGGAGAKPSGVPN